MPWRLPEDLKPVFEQLVDDAVRTNFNPARFGDTMGSIIHLDVEADDIGDERLAEADFADQIQRYKTEVQRQWNWVNDEQFWDQKPAELKVP